MALPEHAIIGLLEPMLKSDGVCVDVGANVGFYTKFLLKKLKGRGKIYSIELAPETCDTLFKEFGHWPNIQLINCAVCDIDGITTFYKGTDNSTNNIIGHDMNFKKNEPGGEVKALRLDSILKDEPEINFIKIDVEGAETLVLRGMEDVLKKTDLIFLECHLDKDWAEIANILMVENNYELFHLGTNEPVTINDPRPYHTICKNKNRV